MDWQNRYSRQSYAQVPIQETHGTDTPYNYPEPPNLPQPQESPRQFLHPEEQQSDTAYDPHDTRPRLSSHYSSYNNGGYTKSARPHRPAHFYVPPVLRLLPLLALFVTTCGIIAAVEFGVRLLPHGEKTKHIDPLAVFHQKRAVGSGLTTIPGNTILPGANLPTIPVVAPPIAAPTPPVAAPVVPPVVPPLFPTGTITPGANLPTDVSVSPPSGQKTQSSILPGANLPTEVSVNNPPTPPPVAPPVQNPPAQNPPVQTPPPAQNPPVQNPPPVQSPPSPPAQNTPPPDVPNLTPGANLPTNVLVGSPPPDQGTHTVIPGANLPTVVVVPPGNTPPPNAQPNAPPVAAPAPPANGLVSTSYGYLPGGANLPTDVVVNTPPAQATGTVLPGANLPTNPGNILTQSHPPLFTLPGANLPTDVTTVVPPTSTGQGLHTVATIPPGANIATDISSSIAPGGNTATQITPSIAPGGNIATQITSTIPPGGNIPTVVPAPNTEAFIPTVINGQSTYILNPTPADGGSYLTTMINGVPTTMVTYSTMNVFLAPTYTISSQVLSTYVTSVASLVVTTGSDGVPTTQTTYVPTTTTGMVLMVTTTNAAEAVNNGSLRFPMGALVIANYVPLLIVVLIRQFWNAIYTQSKLIEPFIRLNTEVGVAASSVLDTFYLSSYWTPDPILAIARKHWFVLWTSIVFYGLSVLAPLSAEFIYLDSDYPDCPILSVGPATNLSPCWPPRLTIDPVFARAIQGILAFAAVMCLSLALMMFRSRTGIYSDPSSIASITSLVHHPEVVNDFRSFSSEASMKEVRAWLKTKFYKLAEYQRSDGEWRYGLVPAVSTLHPFTSETPAKTTKPRFRRWKMVDAILDILFLICVLGLLGVIVGFHLDHNLDDNYDRFFNSGRFGPAFTLTALGILFSMNWKRIERDCHTLSAYHGMASAPTAPNRSILLRKSSIPFTSMFTMLAKGHLFASFIAAIALLSDILILFIGVIPLNPGRVELEVLIAMYLSEAILSAMCIAIVFLRIWKWRLPDLPRAPDTIAAVVSYVADSRMLDDFEGFEYLDDVEMNQRLNATGKRYVYGKRLGSDGQERYLIDEDTQLSYS